MRRVEKPWGYEIIWAKTADYVGKILHINAGHRLSRQYHNVKEETLYVLSGTLCNYGDGEEIERYHPGEAFHVVPKQVHRFGALENDVEVVEVSTPHLDDVVRLADDYTR